MDKKLEKLEQEISDMNKILEMLKGNYDILLTVVGGKEPEEPKFRVGDYAVYVGSGYKEYIKINCIHMNEDGSYSYDAYEEAELRKPKVEELKYFR